MKAEEKYYIYMIRCKDDSIYTGITKDIERRIKEHLDKTNKAAKYTKRVGAIKLEQSFKTNSRKKAAKLEYWIKKLSKKEKENLIKTKDLSILKDKIKKEEYI